MAEDKDQRIDCAPEDIRSECNDSKQTRQERTEKGDHGISMYTEKYISCSKEGHCG